MNKGTESILNILPGHIREAIKQKGNILIEEIRIKIGSPVFLYCGNKEDFLYCDGQVVTGKSEDIDYILKKATKNSLYAYGEDIKNGFITAEGGHRIGLCGRAVYEKEKLVGIKDISSINIRCANELRGVGESVFDSIFTDGKIKNTLIISPPKCGKTTMLRDITRLISLNKNIRIALIDERDEIASAFRGDSINDLGIRTFVMSGYLKKEGFFHAIRGLSPDVIICDEIGGDEDFYNIKEALKRGVKIIATLHGEGLFAIKDKEELEMFECFIVLDKSFQPEIFFRDKEGLYEP